MASAIFGAVRPLAEVLTQSIFVRVVGEDGAVMRRGGEGIDWYYINWHVEHRDIKLETRMSA